MTISEKVKVKARPWIASAGLIYVVVWIIGLVITPSTPAFNSNATEVKEYFINHQTMAMIQIYLIDGIAGATLLAFSAALKEAFKKFDGQDSAISNVIFGAGVAAFSISLVQATIGETLTYHVAERSLEITLMLFNLYNITDTFKMLTLALLTGMSTIQIFRTKALSRWLGLTGALISLLAILGGLSFVLDSHTLFSLLYAALPLLLLWIGAVSFSLLRDIKLTTT